MSRYAKSVICKEGNGVGSGGANADSFSTLRESMMTASTQAAFESSIAHIAQLALTIEVEISSTIPNVWLFSDNGPMAGR